MKYQLTFESKKIESCSDCKLLYLNRLIDKWCCPTRNRSVSDIDVVRMRLIDCPLIELPQE